MNVRVFFRSPLHFVANADHDAKVKVCAVLPEAPGRAAAIQALGETRLLRDTLPFPGPVSLRAGSTRTGVGLGQRDARTNRLPRRPSGVSGHASGVVLQRMGPVDPNASPETTWAWVRDHANRSTLPLAVIAFSADVPVGAACIRATDLASRPDLGPWLGSVYVVPEHRRRGIGRQLVARAENEVWSQGIKKLFLFTYDQEQLYASLGWRFVARCE